MSQNPAELHLSPSDAHLRLMDQLQPALAWQPGCDLANWQARLREKVRKLVGLDVIEEQFSRTPLNVRSLWKREHELGTIEKLAYTSEPGCDVVAYLCLPRNVKPPYPVFICLQGHSTGMHNSIGVALEDETRAIAVDGDRDFAIGCMQRGVAALCIEQRGFGYRRETSLKIRTPDSRTTCQEASVHALMLGRTLTGERVYDVQRGIDLLEQRDDMDLSRLGLMGNSGGGTITMYGSILLDRVRLAMPSCAFCTYNSSLMRIPHCVDNYIPGILRYAELADVMGVLAPKPVVIVAGQTDAIFPIEGVHEAFNRLKAIYAAAGAGDKCRLVVGPEGHRFYADLAWGQMLPLVRKA